MTSAAKAKELEVFAGKFWADAQKRAEAAGMNVLGYLMQVEGGILRPTIGKLLLHAKDHPDMCPPDCVFQASIKRLEERYSVK